MPSLQPELVIGLIIIVILGLIAFKVKVVDLGGLLGSIIIGFLILLGGGLPWLLLLFVFFTLTTYFTKLKYEYKRSIGFAEDKRGARGWPNAFANGGAPAFFALAEFTVGGDVFAIAFLGAVASATADTLATEVGLLSRTPPRLITHLRRRVPPGTSGGITPLGIITAFFASFAIGTVAVALGGFGASPLKVLMIALVGGLVGSTADSLFGATIQGLHKCQVCLAPTERLVHCNRPTLKVRGVRPVDNNVVNFLSTLVGASSAVALLLYLS